MGEYACPKCGNKSLTVSVQMLAEIEFGEDSSHTVHDTFGDIEYDDKSSASCPECGHFGDLGDFKTGGR